MRTAIGRNGLPAGGCRDDLLAIKAAIVRGHQIVERRLVEAGEVDLPGFRRDRRDIYALRKQGRFASDIAKDVGQSRRSVDNAVVMYESWLLKIGRDSGQA